MRRRAECHPLRHFALNAEQLAQPRAADTAADAGCDNGRACDGRNAAVLLRQGNTHGRGNTFGQQ